MTKKLGIGILGCGNISAAYMKLTPLFEGIEIRRCADLDPNVAMARAQEFGILAMPIEELPAAENIDIIVNLTIKVVFPVFVKHFGIGQHFRFE